MIKLTGAAITIFLSDCEAQKWFCMSILLSAAQKVPLNSQGESTLDFIKSDPRGRAVMRQTVNRLASPNQFEQVLLDFKAKLYLDGVIG